MTTRERIDTGAADGGWSAMVRPYATVYHRGGLVVAADYNPADDVLAGWWSYTAPGLGQLAFVTARDPLALTLLGWLAEPATLIESALGTVAAAEEAAARLLAVIALCESFALHDPGAVIEVAPLGHSLLHVVAPERYPEPSPMPLPRLERPVGVR